MDAVEHRYPNALIQFEDFQTPHANPLLEKYRDNFRMFNDDIQGTGTVALAAMMGAMRATGKPFEALAEQRSGRCAERWPPRLMMAGSQR